MSDAHDAVVKALREGQRTGAQPADMAEAILAALHKIASGGGWWCPRCEEEVDGSTVTYEEVHEVCGAYVGGRCRCLSELFTACA